MFRAVNSKVSFPQIENNIGAFWKEHKVFEKSVDFRKNSDKHFTLYEGPPTANGKPGIHHVLARVFKDVIPRYKTMKGYYAPRKSGWDTHGLPVELEIEKKLGFTSKSDIENYGIAKFNKLCRESVFNYVKEWETLTDRIAFWVDMEHPYMTLENNYIESVWYELKQLWDKNLIYLGYRVTPHCPRCGTSLSSHEIAQGYKDDTVDPSVFIKFKLIPSSLKNGSKLESLLKTTAKPAYLLAWTTTPWTLPGNTALAVSQGSEYSLLENDDEFLILASPRIEATKPDGYNSMGNFQGEELVGVKYQPLFNPHEFNVDRSCFTSHESGSYLEIQKPDTNLVYKVIAADFVSMDDGTGIVHIAPAFGELDYEAGQQNNLNFVQHVDLDGKITGSYPFTGKFVKTADPLVLDNLKSRNLLFRASTITHTYPFCWRCNAPVLYYAKKSWYIKTTAKKQELISGNKKINWYPEHIKNGRFGDWLENNVDWAFSRERYWGTPLNIWQCTSCNSYESIGSIDDLRSKPDISGVNEPVDLHRPYVDTVTFTCSKCHGTMKRQPEVIDCWFDSGSMPFAQWHYPFENKELFKERFPADYICEAVDQTRGWFYSLHAISTMLMGQPCFNNVICLGLIVDAQGEKMSKTRGNIVDPWSVINKFGADSIRWYLLTSTPPGNVHRFSSEGVEEVMRNVLMTLWNTYSFFVMYANIDNYSPKSGQCAPVADLDKWIISRLNLLIMDVDTLLENYDPTTAGRKIESFIDDLSNWYIRRSRRRFWKSQNDEDKLSAYSTLYNCLLTLCKLIAPFTPFIAEEIYQNLVRSADPDAPVSIHLTDFPVADKSLIDIGLNDITNGVITVCSLGRAARAKAGVKVRQPLSRVIIKTPSPAQREGMKKLSAQILEELNVKNIEFAEKDLPDSADLVSLVEGDYCIAVDTALSAELAAEGTAREIVRRLQVMRKAAGLEIADHINLYYKADTSIQEVINQFADYIKQETLADSIAIETSPDGAYSEKAKIASSEVIFGIRKA
jgi:isoleucyl-tRNA synthetase